MTAAGIAGMGHETAADYRYTPAVAAELRGLLDAAEREAADDDVSARIAFLRLGLNMTELWEKLDDKARRAANGEPVDRALARRLLDLNALALRDIVANHHFALNVVGLAHYSNAFSKWTPLEADTEARVLPSERDLFERVATPRYGLSGKEKGLEDMLQAFGL